MSDELREDTVDLWDLTKLLFHRWYVFGPLLLASAAAVLFGSSAVKPDYQATGHIQLIPPVVERGPTDTVRNPWLNLGLQALGQAVIVNVQGERVSRNLVAAGLTENFAVTMENGASYFSIESVGKTPQQATATTQRLMDLVRTQVQAQQRQFGATARDLITTLDLDNGDEVKPITTTRKRFLVAAIGVCLLVTIAVTVGVDALLRWRDRRRRSTAGPVDPPQPAEPPGSDLTDGVQLERTVVPAGVRKIHTTPSIPARPPSAVPSAGKGEDERIRGVLSGFERADPAEGQPRPRSLDPALGQKNTGP